MVGISRPLIPYRRRHKKTSVPRRGTRGHMPIEAGELPRYHAEKQLCRQLG